ncbi:hypothetical protein GCM10008960_34910 [Deinococcus sedimenti]|uniref:Uncharacterized protein n=2 Tax=Deinococcus sedimenti TaxID=1867090 RepID=A0ABQ2SBL5_9DEIO|nr:hypothetical protein GCM10008960_34910 [Deinococcus sedimenti]
MATMLNVLGFTLLLIGLVRMVRAKARRRPVWRAGWRFLAGWVVLSFLAQAFSPAPPNRAATASESPERSAQTPPWPPTIDDMLDQCWQVAIKASRVTPTLIPEVRKVYQDDRGYVISGTVQVGERSEIFDCSSTAPGQAVFGPGSGVDEQRFRDVMANRPVPAVAAAEPAPEPEAAPAPVAAASPAQNVPTAQALANLGADPKSERVLDTSSGEGRVYHTWDVPRWGQRVSGVRRGAADWWIKITGPSLGADDLASADQRREIASNGVAITYLITGGPLRGHVMTVSDPAINLYSPAWYATDVKGTLVGETE